MKSSRFFRSLERDPIKCNRITLPIPLIVAQSFGEPLTLRRIALLEQVPAGWNRLRRSDFLHRQQERNLLRRMRGRGGTGGDLMVQVRRRY